MTHPTARRTATRGLREGPPTRLLLARGLTRRCSRCGERDVFDGWFTFAASCPRCHLHFQDEEGFFLGAYLVNLTLVFTVVFLALIGLSVQLGSNPDANPLPLGAVGLFGAVVLPVLGYPFACTTWVALLVSGGRAIDLPAAEDQSARATPTGHDTPVPPIPQ